MGTSSFGVLFRKTAVPIARSECSATVVSFGSEIIGGTINGVARGWLLTPM